MSRLTSEPSHSGTGPRRIKGNERTRAASSDFPSSSASGSAAPKTRQPGSSSRERSNVPSRPKVDVSHFPHYGLKRGMACTFCRRRKLRCSGDRPSCTNCVKYTKACEYGPPVKDPKKQQDGKKASAPVYDAAMMSGAMPLHPEHLGVPPIQAVPIYTAQAHRVDGPQATHHPAFVDHHLVASSSGLASSFEHQHDLDAYHHQQHIAHHAMASSLNKAMPQPPFVPSSVSHATMALPLYVPPSATRLGSYQDSAEIWQPPTTPALQSTGPALLTPLHPPTSIVTDSWIPEPVYDPRLTSADMFSNAGAATQYPSSGQSAPSVEGHHSGRQSSIDSAEAAYSPNSLASKLYLEKPSLHYVADVSTIDGLTDRLGEFLFDPKLGEKETLERKRSKKASGIADSQSGSPRSTAVAQTEYDGLSDEARARFIDGFIAHSELFFEMSIPRFRYRLTFSDRRRPSLALLYAMYMWATRITERGQNTSMEKQFFDQGCKHLLVTIATTDRLMDAVHAAYLLGVYSFLSARHHEGWCLAGIGVRLVVSCGLHRIPSCTLRPAEEQNPFLRHRNYLLPPPEDTVELANRIHGFWAIFALDRCGALCTGYPASLRDEDITTPFPLGYADIVSGNVSERDDRTVRDLYHSPPSGGLPDTIRSRWTKCTTVLERASKIVFLEPEQGSPYKIAWSQYSASFQQDKSLSPPADYLNQPKFRNPKDHMECVKAIEEIIKSNGEEGIFPPTRMAQAQAEGLPEPEIPSYVIMFHHMISAAQVFLHDINSLNSENVEALKAARKSVKLFQVLPPIPFTDVDAFIVQIWFMIAKVLVKEIHRLVNLGDMENAFMVAVEVDVVQREMARIGMTMHVANTQAKALDELKTAALRPATQDSQPTVGLNLENFLFPQHMS